jgi:FADH2-dependent halogenase
MKFDVAIIGGGPAGSTAATILAMNGRRVVVLEKDRFPRFHIGESLLPRSMGVLERIGVLEKIESAGFVKKFGAEIEAGCGRKSSRFYFKDGFRASGDHAFQVERAEFDRLLLDHARESGADVREGTAVRGVSFTDHGARVEIPDGVIEADYVLDCSGRGTLLASQLGIKEPYPGLNKFAVYAHYENVDRPQGVDGTLTRMVRAKDRWFWMIPLSPTKMSVGVVMDTSAFRELRASPEQVLKDSIAMLPVMRDRMARSERVTPAHTCGDYSYRNTALHGRRWLLAGDAAGFIDPVFSSGIFLGMLGAEQAADALHTALDHPDRARPLFDRYQRRMRKVMKIYLTFVRGWYRQEFIETVLNPQNILQIVPAVNAVLAGNVGTSFALTWRLALFRLIVRAQRHLPLCPPLQLKPESA